MGLFSFLTQEIAIDLGTANTIIIHNDKIVVDEPSIVAVDKNTGKLSGTPKEADVGSYWSNVTVRDGEGGLAFHNVTITVPQPFIPQPENQKHTMHQ